MNLFDRNAASPGELASVLDREHYLGSSWRGFGYEDEIGVLVFAAPTSRRLPRDWVELARWCIRSHNHNSHNLGSMQWARVRRWLALNAPAVTTVISYSDPSAGHDGALYRACNWLWAPTWLRLREPPTGNGNWGKEKTAAKDRWIFPLLKDERRAVVLRVNDESLVSRMPWASYREPKWYGHRFDAKTGGGNYQRFNL
jgi:hypothetical protein